MPAAISGDVTALGRIIGYTPHHTKRPDNFPLECRRAGCDRPVCWTRTTPPRWPPTAIRARARPSCSSSSTHSTRRTSAPTPTHPGYPGSRRRSSAKCRPNSMARPRWICKWHMPLRRTHGSSSSMPGRHWRATGRTRRSAGCSRRRIGDIPARYGACRSGGHATRWRVPQTSHQSKPPS